MDRKKSVFSCSASRCQGPRETWNVVKRGGLKASETVSPLFKASVTNLHFQFVRAASVSGNANGSTQRNDMCSHLKLKRHSYLCDNPKIGPTGFPDGYLTMIMNTCICFS